MFTKNIKRGLKKNVLPVIVFVAILFLWETAVLVFKIPSYFLPKPSEIIIEIISNFQTLLENLGITMLEVISGFIIANILGFVTAVVFVHSKTIERSLYPYVLSVKMTPIIAIAPFLVVWFGVGILSKIATVVVICFFPILVNTIKGLKLVDNEALDLFDSLSANKWQIFLKLRLPNSFPYIFQALKMAAPLAIVGALVGEFVGGNKGIGYIILTYTTLFETTKAFSAIIVIIIVGILFFGLISLIEKMVTRSKEPKENQ